MGLGQGAWVHLTGFSARRNGRAELWTGRRRRGHRTPRNGAAADEGSGPGAAGRLFVRLKAIIGGSGQSGADAGSSLPSAGFMHVGWGAGLGGGLASTTFREQLVAGVAGRGGSGQAWEMQLRDEITACRLCAARFAATATAHAPRPVVWFRPGARIMVAGQAPGLRVHGSGRPFTDRSGDRLRDWMGVTEAELHDLDRVAVVPMAFCFPGYDAIGSDLPPPPICAATWRARVLAALGDMPLTLLVGGAAIRWHGGLRHVTEAVADWRAPAARGVFPLPHPSWRNTGWLKRHPWFEAELLAALRQRVREVLDV